MATVEAVTGFGVATWPRQFFIVIFRSNRISSFYIVGKLVSFSGELTNLRNLEIG